MQKESPTFLRHNDGMHTQAKAILTINSNQEETDLRVILYSKYTLSNARDCSGSQHRQRRFLYTIPPYHYCQVQYIYTTNAWKTWCLDSLRNTELHSWHSMHLLIVIPPVLLRESGRSNPIKQFRQTGYSACACATWETWEFAKPMSKLTYGL